MFPLCTSGTFSPVTSSHKGGVSHVSHTRLLRWGRSYACAMRARNWMSAALSCFTTRERCKRSHRRTHSYRSAPLQQCALFFFFQLIFLMIGCSTPENNSTLVWHSFSTPLPPTSSAPSPPQRAAPHVPPCPLCQPLHQGRIWGLGAVERLLSQVDSQIAAVAFDGEKWAGQVSDGSPAGRQAHRLALIKKAPLLCSHRRWM